MVRKRVITLGIVLGLMVNWIIIQAEQAKSADNYVIPQYIMDDMQKNVGYNNKTVNNYESQRNQQPQQVVTMDRNLYNQSQPIQYSRQVTIDQNVYRQPTQTQNNNYYQYQQASNYNPNRPEWKDFAPYGLDDVMPDPKEGTYFNPNKAFQAYKQRYWYDRRQDFEKDLLKCDKLLGEYQNVCYQKLINRQLEINTLAKQQEEKELAIRMQQQMAQQQYYLQQQQIQAAKQAAIDERNFQREQMFNQNQNQMITNQLNRIHDSRQYVIQQPTTYRFYNQYGQPTGYVQQTNW